MGGTSSELSLDLELPAVAESCPLARRAVRAVLDPMPIDHAAVDLAVSEAVTNVVVHAYRDRDATDPGQLRVAVAVEADGARITVADTGSGMRPRDDSPGLGFGLALIASACDELDIEQGDAGTRVHMRFGHRRAEA